jgi:mannitol-1-phosphate 5-dehydrogenase
MTPTIVQFGAGAIGRGFLGQLWTEGGYEAVFVDIGAALVDQLNARQSYPLRLVGNGSAEERIIQPVRALLNDGTREAATAIGVAVARSAFCCTAVGVHVFSHLALVLASGIFVRHQRGYGPLNIICCENQKGAAALLRAEVEKHLPPDTGLRDFFAKSVGFVDASVGRMVPPPTPEMLAEDPLLVAAEPYKELPVDGAAWVGPVPSIPGLLLKQNFAGYVARKLFTHNGGHALLAYHGYRCGHEYLWQCAEDPELVAELRGFWGEVGPALVQAYQFDPDEQRAHEDDLLRRFRNRALGDTVLRVGRDPARKLRAEDRLVGAALLVQEQGGTPLFAARAIAAALFFSPPEDSSADEVQTTLRREGIRGALAALSGIPADAPLALLVEDAYNTLARG